MDLLSRFIDQIDSPHTRRAYETDLTDFLERQLDNPQPEHLQTLSRGDVRAYVRSLQSEGLSESTQRRRLSALRRFFDFLMDQGYTDRNPARACRIDLAASSGTVSDSKDAAAVLSKSEAETLIRATDGAGAAAVRDRALLLTILYAALRRAEVAAMDVEHVRPLGRHWVIDLPAGDAWSSAYVKIPETVVEAIEQVQSRYGIDDGALWRSLSNRNHGERMTPDAIYKVVRRTAERAGIGSVTVDTLRQTGLRLAMDAGASMQQVKQHGRLQSSNSIDQLTDSQERKNRLSNSAVDVLDLDLE